MFTYILLLILNWIIAIILIFLPWIMGGISGYILIVTKGYKPQYFYGEFWLGYFLGPLGILIAALMPKKGGNINEYRR